LIPYISLSCSRSVFCFLRSSIFFLSFLSVLLKSFYFLETWRFLSMCVGLCLHQCYIISAILKCWIICTLGCRCLWKRWSSKACIWRIVRYMQTIKQINLNQLTLPKCFLSLSLRSWPVPKVGNFFSLSSLTTSSVDIELNLLFTFCVNSFLQLFCFVYILEGIFALIIDNSENRLTYVLLCKIRLLWAWSCNYLLFLIVHVFISFF